MISSFCQVYGVKEKPLTFNLTEIKTLIFTGDRRNGIKHNTPIQILKDFSYKISHLGQREGDEDVNRLTPAEIII